jgi:uncharacterized membrane protein YczE/cyclopropane fatty-acyl-phospholipid synthase-like methyltransferase
MEKGTYLVTFLKKMFSVFIGTFILALGVTMNMKANIGYAPWEVFHWGFSQTANISLGMSIILTGAVLCIVATLLGEKLGFGTLVNFFISGVIIDIIFALDIIPQMNSLIPGILMMVAGLFVMAFGTYFYIRPGLGAGPRDSLMVALERKTGLPVGACRAIVEISVTIIGWLLGGPVGLGTVLAAVGISFCVQIVFTLMRFDATNVKHETIDVTFKSFFKKDMALLEGTQVSNNNTKAENDNEGTGTKMQNEARERWDKRYSERDTLDCDATVLQPDVFVAENLELFKKGSLLDIACGDGRNAIYMAQKGFNLLGVDISPVGLERLNKFAAEAGVSVDTKEMDLTDMNAAEKLLSFGKFDNIIVIRYRLNDKLLDIIPDLLEEEGIFMLCSFNCRSVEKGFEKQFCFEEGELLNRFPDFTLIKYETFEVPKGYLDGYIFKKEKKS